MSAPYYVITVTDQSGNEVAKQCVSADSGYLTREVFAKRLAEPLGCKLGKVTETLVDGELSRVVKSYTV